MILPLRRFKKQGQHTLFFPSKNKKKAFFLKKKQKKVAGFK
jgi:hypothetical protein